MEGKTQEAAAAAAGMSVRSARKWERGPGPARYARPRHWRTRRDPFAEVFTNEVIPLLEADREGVLEAKTILTELERRHPGQFGAGQLRTLQRRLREWRAVEGPDKEVYFPQHHPPGREAAYDFTDLSSLGVSIAGEPFAHLLFELVLSFSGWRWPLVVFSENFETLSAAVQGALWELGGAAEVLRSDNLSAATHQLYGARGRALTKRYRELLDHYGLRASPINPGHAHENGVVEQAHRRSKSLLAQALLLRRSRDFASVEDYQSWVRATIEREHNHLRGAKLAEEKQYLRPLPEAALPCHTVMLARVRRWSTIRVQGRTYSVPARLIGEQVRIRWRPPLPSIVVHHAAILEFNVPSCRTRNRRNAGQRNPGDEPNREAIIPADAPRRRPSEQAAEK